MSNWITRFFPILAVAFSVIAYFTADWFSQWRSSIVPMLMVVMLGMGLTLKASDFLDVLKKAWIILIGVGIQYTVMPAAAFFLSLGLGLEKELLIGMVLVGATAGGTASNVICYLAGGWVALSVSMTLVSTLFAALLTPFITWLYLGEAVNVPVSDMMLSMVKMIVLPLTLGIVVNTLFEKQVSKLRGIAPVISVLAIVWIIAIVVALNASSLPSVGILLAVAVILHNAIGMLAGYLGSRLLNQNEQIARTVAIEVGMQNSGLSVALATQFFTTLSALPGALFSIWHNVSGSLVASWWSRRISEDKQ